MHLRVGIQPHNLRFLIYFAFHSVAYNVDKKKGKKEC